jgi:thiaminase/transcriptional activator TenA
VLTVASLIERFAQEWRAATRHAFLDAVRDGSLPAEAFDRWLAQDYLFVGDLLVFQRRLAARTALAVIAEGAEALDAELRWFEQHAARRGLNLDAQRTPTAEAYRVLLEALDAAAEPVAIGRAGRRGGDVSTGVTTGSGVLADDVVGWRMRHQSTNPVRPRPQSAA